MPFKSRSQIQACFAKQTAGETGWNCREWLAHTPSLKKLPKRIKKKAAGGLGDLLKIASRGLTASRVLSPALAMPPGTTKNILGKYIYGPPGLLQGSSTAEHNAQALAQMAAQQKLKEKEQQAAGPAVARQAPMLPPNHPWTRGGQPLLLGAAGKVAIDLHDISALEIGTCKNAEQLSLIEGAFLAAASERGLTVKQALEGWAKWVKSGDSTLPPPAKLPAESPLTSQTIPSSAPPSPTPNPLAGVPGGTSGRSLSDMALGESPAPAGPKPEWNEATRQSQEAFGRASVIPAPPPANPRIPHSSGGSWTDPERQGLVSDFRFHRFGQGDPGYQPTRPAGDPELQRLADAVDAHRQRQAQKMAEQYTLASQGYGPNKFNAQGGFFGDQNTAPPAASVVGQYHERTPFAKPNHWDPKAYQHFYPEPRFDNSGEVTGVDYRATEALKKLQAEQMKTGYGMQDNPRPQYSPEQAAILPDNERLNYYTQYGTSKWSPRGLGNADLDMAAVMAPAARMSGLGFNAARAAAPAVAEAAPAVAEAGNAAAPNLLGRIGNAVLPRVEANPTMLGRIGSGIEVASNPTNLLWNPLMASSRFAPRALGHVGSMGTNIMADNQLLGGLGQGLSGRGLALRSSMLPYIGSMAVRHYSGAEDPLGIGRGIDLASGVSRGDPERTWTAYASPFIKRVDHIPSALRSGLEKYQQAGGIAGIGEAAKKVFEPVITGAANLTGGLWDTAKQRWENPELPLGQAAKINIAARQLGDQTETPTYGTAAPAPDFHAGQLAEMPGIQGTPLAATLQGLSPETYQAMPEPQRQALAQQVQQQTQQMRSQLGAQTDQLQQQSAELLDRDPNTLNPQERQQYAQAYRQATQVANQYGQLAWADHYAKTGDPKLESFQQMTQSPAFQERGKQVLDQHLLEKGLSEPAAKQGIAEVWGQLPDHFKGMLAIGVPLLLAGLLTGGATGGVMGLIGAIAAGLGGYQMYQGMQQPGKEPQLPTGINPEHVKDLPAVRDILSGKNTDPRAKARYEAMTRPAQQTTGPVPSTAGAGPVDHLASAQQAAQQQGLGSLFAGDEKQMAANISAFVQDAGNKPKAVAWAQSLSPQQASAVLTKLQQKAGWKFHLLGSTATGGPLVAILQARAKGG